VHAVTVGGANVTANAAAPATPDAATSAITPIG
jgi:hypothetical protein